MLNLQQLEHRHLIRNSVKIFSGLGSEFRELSATIHARYSTISQEELYGVLLDYELFLKYDEARKTQPLTITAAIEPGPSTTPPRNTANTNMGCQGNNVASNQPWHSQPNSNLRCQLCDHPGHSAKVCRS